MIRRVIVELAKPSHTAQESLSNANLSLPGLSIDEDFDPIPLDQSSAQTMDTHSQEAMDLDQDADEAILIRGDLDSDQESALLKHPEVVAVWSDAEVAAFSECEQCRPTELDFLSIMEESEDIDLVDDLPEPFDVESNNTHCPPTDCAYKVPKGNLNNVAQYLGCHKLWEKGIRGAGVGIGIVDTGVDKRRVKNVVGGWSPNPRIPWGVDAGTHGSMTATDALGMAPDAKIYDLGLLKSTKGISRGFLSDAIQAFQFALTEFQSKGMPQILSNSWGIYQKSWGPDYAVNPNHPFTRKVVEVINKGMIVTFAAGNCGQTCPSGRCAGDNGPGRSIWGANGHPKVITVGAANIRDQLIGYSSQGPAALSAKKPDFCAPSHFTGFTRSDNGTSAANPVCAGVIALLLGHNPKLKQAAIKEALASTAKNLCGSGWDADSGSGMIHANHAFHKLNYFKTPLVHANWTHGHSVQVQNQGDIEQQRHLSWYSYHQGKANSSNRFHFAVPTPVIVHNHRLRLDSVMLMFYTTSDTMVTDVRIYDGYRLLKSYRGLKLKGAHWFERFDVLENLVRFGIGVSVDVKFGDKAQSRAIYFTGCGGDFV